MRRVPGADPADVDDVILGCAMPEAEQGLNVARIASLRAGLPVSASAVTVNRFCSSGLQAIAYGAERILLGHASAVVAGGTESMSLIPMGGHTVSPNPALVDSYPDVYLSTGLVAENHARQSNISREAQDAFALASHRARARRHRKRPLRRGDRAGDRTGGRGGGRRRRADDPRGHRRSRRRPAAGYLAAGARQAGPGVPRRRHGHRRQLVADQRRGVGAAAGVGPVRARSRAGAAGPLRRLRDRGRATRAVRHRTGAGRAERC